MNFKRMSLVISGVLKEAIKKNEQLRVSNGMQAAFNLVSEIMMLNFSNVHGENVNDIFGCDTHESWLLDEAIKQSSRISVELSIAFGENVGVAFYFFSRNRRLPQYIFSTGYAIQSGENALLLNVNVKQHRI